MFARCEHDVVAAVRTGTRGGHGVLARSGPHHGPFADGAEIVVVTAGLDHVDVDPVARQARVGVGATWRDVARAAAVHGLAPVAGDDPDATVGSDVVRGADGPWCRSLGPVASAVGAVDAVTVDGRLVTLAGTDALAADRRGRPPVPTSWQLRLVPAVPVTVVRCHDVGTEVAVSVRRWLAATAGLAPDTATALVVSARRDAPVTWWLAARGPAHAPAGWPEADVDVTRRPAGATLRWPPAARRGPVETVTLPGLPAGGAAVIAEAVAADRRGAVVLRHRAATPDGPWLDLLARGVTATRLRDAFAGPVVSLPTAAARP